MNSEYYETIFKRKSFHLYRGAGYGKLSEEDLEGIRTAYAAFEPLYPDIKTAIRILPSGRLGLKLDSEYCILLYSEKKTNYLMNAGYLGEQLDLYLTAHSIGPLWYGIGRPDESVFEGLDYVIMIAVRKVTDESLFRKDMFKAKRKPLEEIWSGDTLGVAEIARFSPSACNSQPWTVRNEDGVLRVMRYKKRGRIGILTPSAANWFNRIDVGIFLCILEICMAQKGIAFERELFADTGDEELTPVADYRLQ